MGSHDSSLDNRVYDPTFPRLCSNCSCAIRAAFPGRLMLASSSSSHPILCPRRCYCAATLWHLCQRHKDSCPPWDCHMRHGRCVNLFSAQTTRNELPACGSSFCRALANATSSKHCFRQLHFTIALTNWRRAVIRCRCLLGGQQLADGGLESLIALHQNAGRRENPCFRWAPRRAFAVGGAPRRVCQYLCARMRIAAPALHRIGDARAEAGADK